MIVLRKDKLGRVHYKNCLALSEVEATANDIGAVDGDDVFVIEDSYYNTNVRHYVATAPTKIKLILQSDLPIQQ